MKSLYAFSFQCCFSAGYLICAMLIRVLHSLHVTVKFSFLIHHNEIAWPFASGLSSHSSLKCLFPRFTQLYESVSTGTHKPCESILTFIETKHDTMCFNLATPLLNLELYIVFEYRHYAKTSTHPGKKAQKALQPIKKKQATEKKAQKSTGAFKSTHYDPCNSIKPQNSP